METLPKIRSSNGDGLIIFDRERRLVRVEMQSHRTLGQESASGRLYGMDDALSAAWAWQNAGHGAIRLQLAGAEVEIVLTRYEAGRHAQFNVNGPIPDQF
jgi:hypothetical protein